jgi:hypothetical protein
MRLQCDELKYVLLGLILLPILIVVVVTAMIPVSDLESPSFFVVLFSQFIHIFIHSHHVWFVFCFIVIGTTILWSGYFSDNVHLRTIGVIALMGIPALIVIMLYLTLLPIDPYFLTYTNPLLSEIVIIAFFMCIGFIMALLGKVVVGHFSGSCPIRKVVTSHTKQVLGYGLFIWGTWFAILLGVLLDYINNVPLTESITLFGITGTRSEWFQNVFLMGIMTIMVPTLLLVGYLGRSYKLKLSHTFLIIITALIIGSAIWDLVFAMFFPLPETEFYWWFDPFGLGLIKGLNLMNLATFKIEGGLILMDTEFMKFFSYLRLLIFVPLLIIELWRFTK